VSAKPLILFNPLPRPRAQIFSATDWSRLNALGRVIGSGDARMQAGEVDRYIADAAIVVDQTDLPGARLDHATRLRAIINVEGNFLQNIDYETCFARGIHVLGIGPVFAQPVAEWALGAALDLARGLTSGDRAMRDGVEAYGSRANAESFVLAGAEFGMIGFGNLGRALLSLLRAFGGRVSIHDPWLPDGFIRAQGAEPARLDAVLATSRVLFILAGVTAENAGFLDRAKLATIRRDAVVVLASRAAIVEFAAFTALVNEGAFRAATDVFPKEPARPLRSGAPLAHPALIASRGRAAKRAARHRRDGGRGRRPDPRRSATGQMPARRARDRRAHALDRRQ